MEDIAPKLLETLRNDFEKNMSENPDMRKILDKIKSGGANYEDAGNYAFEVGDALAKSFGQNLSSAVLPDGKMYFNIADRAVRPLLEEDYRLVNDAAIQVQTALNEKAGIGIKAQKADLDEEGIDNIINKITAVDKYDDVAWMLNDPVKTFSQSVVDNTLRKNVEFQGKAGMEPMIIRKAESKCCKWCSALEGKYPYPEVPQDIYRRHNNCRCVVEYDPGEGKKRQNVHSKEWKTTEERMEIEARKTVGLDEKLKLSHKKGVDVTDIYAKGKYPGQGALVLDDGYDREEHKEELRVAQWIHNNLGGDIQLLNESSVDGVKRPDYIWKGKYWELKSTSTEKAANSAIRKGIKQIEENPGGIILNYSNDVDLQMAIDVVEKRMKGSKQGDIPVDIMIIKNEKMIIVLRY